MVARDVAELEDPVVAADLMSRACLRERICKGRKKPLVLHADKGNAISAATLEPIGEVGRAQILFQAKGLK